MLMNYKVPAVRLLIALVKLLESGYRQAGSGSDMLREASREVIEVILDAGLACFYGS